MNLQSAWGLWTFFGGLLFSFMRERTGSVLAPAILHGFPQGVSYPFGRIVPAQPIRSGAGGAGAMGPCLACRCAVEWGTSHYCRGADLRAVCGSEA